MLLEKPFIAQTHEAQFTKHDSLGGSTILSKKWTHAASDLHSCSSYLEFLSPDLLLTPATETFSVEPLGNDIPHSF